MSGQYESRGGRVPGNGVGLPLRAESLMPPCGADRRRPRPPRGSPRPRGGLARQRRHDLGERHLLQRTEPQVGVADGHLRRQRVRHDDATEPCGLRGRHPVRRVLDRERLMRLGPQPFERQRVQRRVRLRLPYVLPRAYHVERRQQPEPAEMPVHPLAARARRYRQPQPRLLRLLDMRRDALPGWERVHHVVLLPPRPFARTASRSTVRPKRSSK